MSKKRVHEVAKQLQKSNKELIDYLKKNNIEVQTHMSTLSDEQVAMVQKAFVKQPEAKQASPAGGQPKTEEAPKKRISAVFRPQNSSQKPKRPAQTSSQSQRPAAGTQPGQRPAADAAKQPQKPIQATEVQTPKSTEQAPVSSGQSQAPSPQPAAGSGSPAAPAQSGQSSQSGYQGQRSQGGYQGQRSQSGYQGQRSNQSGQGGGYQGQRSTQGGQGGGYQGQRSTQGGQGGGYQGQRSNQGGQGGYQGQRSPGGYQGQGGQGGQGGGYQGQRNNQGGQGGYQGQRSPGGYQGQGGQGGQGGGYQGQRNNQGGQGGYQGQRSPGGYQGQGGQGGQGGGYQGQRNNQGGQGGYQGQRSPGGYQGQGGQGGQGGGYQGQRSNQGGQGGGYQGQRSNQGGQGGGYQGQRSNQGGQGGGYQGQRGQSGGQGGYNRGGQGGGGGYQGQRGQSGGQGGYNNNRQGQGGQGQKPNMNKPLFDTQAKPQNNRQNKGKPVSRYDNKKKDYNEDQKPGKGKFIKPVKVAQPVEEVKNIILPDTLTIKELADKMKIQPSAIVKKLFLEGKVVTLNQEIDFDMAEEIALEYDISCEKEVKIDVLEELLKEAEDSAESMVSRPPVVCVMGHVDHGKTSLLDTIRKTNVTAKEAGGITQHIGAYVIESGGQKITFLDTPGHEAFTAMRMRGAQSTDIAILVVAADDGVMPQTIEAINHAKAADVEIIVAINKIDKPSANIDRVKQEMAEYELVPEDWGGSTIFVPVSAHTGEGIDTLLEMILLVAEVKELKANPNRNARGLVIEAELDKGKGPVATILVQKGTLKVGDAVAAGACYGKVRAMMDDKGRRLKEAGPSTPVEILGLDDVPSAGEIFVGTENDKEARNFAATFIKEGREKLLEDTKAKLSLDDLFSQIKSGNIKELNIIIKADVQGSVEAVKQSLVKLSNEEVMVKVLHGGVGAINESDVMLASASNAIIIGFNVRPDVSAKSVAEREKVDLRLYKVIYQAIEDVEAAMKGMLDPIFEEKVIGHAMVRQTFKASGIGTIAGAYVTDGKFQRGCSTRITREGKLIYEGPLVSLKRFKDDVKEVATGYECGLVFEKFNDLQEDDMVEAYIMAEVPR